MGVMRSSPERDPDRPWWDTHPPSAADERAAARASLRYARALQRGDVAAACGMAFGRAARKCGTIRCGGARVFHAEERGPSVDVRLDTCHLTVARRADRWVVVDQVPQVGLA